MRRLLQGDVGSGKTIVTVNLRGLYMGQKHWRRKNMELSAMYGNEPQLRLRLVVLLLLVTALLALLVGPPVLC